MAMCVIRALEAELDACVRFAASRSQCDEAVARVVRAMEIFLAQYKLAHHVRDTDGGSALEPERCDDAVERGDEVVGDEEPFVAHA